MCEEFHHRSSKAILQEPNGSDYFKREGCAKVFLLSFESHFYGRKSDPAVLRVYKNMIGFLQIRTLTRQGIVRGGLRRGFCCDVLKLILLKKRSCERCFLIIMQIKVAILKILGRKGIPTALIGKDALCENVLVH